AAAVIAFAAVAYFLDNGDLRAVVARMAQVLRLRPPDWLGGRGHQASQDARGQVPRMSNSHQHDPAKLTRDGAMMTRLERQGAIGIGVAAGIAGGIAVFTTSNQAGTAFLLLISLVFLVMGVEGTALVRGFGADALRLRRGRKERQLGPGPTPATAPDPVPAADTSDSAATHQQDMSYEEVMAALTDERQL
ncbi:MAG TPA: hypothetical protein VF506_12425, partial [Streptosporangiaceae bacterium]